MKPIIELKEELKNNFEKEELFFRKLLSKSVHPKKILFLQHNIEEVLKSIIKKNPDYKQLLLSKLGNTLSQFVEKCEKSPQLLSLVGIIRQTLNGIKGNTIYELFGIDFFIPARGNYFANLGLIFLYPQTGIT